MGTVEGFNGRYWSPKNGKLTHYDKKSGEATEVRGIFGNLSRISMFEDPGKPEKQIKPGWKVNVSLDDDGEIEILSFRAETTFGWMLAQSLSAIKPGERIIVETSGGNDERICFAWVKRYDDNKKTDIERPDWGTDRDAKIAIALEAYKNHPALNVTAPPDDYNPFEDE